MPCRLTNVFWEIFVSSQRLFGWIIQFCCLAVHNFQGDRAFFRYEKVSLHWFNKKIRKTSKDKERKSFFIHHKLNPSNNPHWKSWSEAKEIRSSEWGMKTLLQNFGEIKFAVSFCGQNKSGGWRGRKKRKEQAGGRRMSLIYRDLSQ